MGWPALSPEQVRARVHAALDANRSYFHQDILGLPGTILDQCVFPATPAVLERPWLRTAVENPNHIGCHTLGDSEPAFAGTHQLEREVIGLCAVDILGAEPNTVDGYIAAGGTESNVQALWAFRNRWRAEGVSMRRVGVLCTQDTHYSIHKGADILGLALAMATVDHWSRQPTPAGVRAAIAELQAQGIDHVMVVLTMGTTMFGTVEHPAPVLECCDAAGLTTLLHVDAAFGGFIYPLLAPACELGFCNPRVQTLTLDAHKMLQAPYGTGVHLARKGWLSYTTTATASYVPGLDCTLSGSRSGANAVAIWMILQSWGFAGGRQFVDALAARAAWFADQLRSMGCHPIHTACMNVVVLPEAEVPLELSARYLLVPDHHACPRWRKVVVMEHVTKAALCRFLSDLSAARGPCEISGEGPAKEVFDGAAAPKA